MPFHPLTDIKCSEPEEKNTCSKTNSSQDQSSLEDHFLRHTHTHSLIHSLYLVRGKTKAEQNKTGNKHTQTYTHLAGAQRAN